MVSLRDFLIKYNFTHLPDVLWLLIEYLFVPYIHTRSGGKKPISHRLILDGIIFKLKTGCQWHMLPKEYGGSSTVYEHFHIWSRDGVIDKVEQVLIKVYAETIGFDGSFQSMDGTIVQAPVRTQNSEAEGLGANPTDRGRSGTKTHAHVDKNGAPFGHYVTGANTHDSKLVTETINDSKQKGEHFVVPESEGEAHLCMDKGYDFQRVKDEVESLGFTPHIRSRGEEKIAKEERTEEPKRWVVERTFAWLKGHRSIRTRYDHKLMHYKAFVSLGFGIILYRKVIKASATQASILVALDSQVADAQQRYWWGCFNF